MIITRLFWSAFIALVLIIPASLAFGQQSEDEIDYVKLAEKVINDVIGYIPLVQMALKEEGLPHEMNDVYDKILEMNKVLYHQNRINELLYPDFYAEEHDAYLQISNDFIRQIQESEGKFMSVGTDEDDAALGTFNELLSEQIISNSVTPPEIPDEMHDDAKMTEDLPSYLKVPYEKMIEKISDEISIDEQDEEQKDDDSVEPSPINEGDPDPQYEGDPLIFKLDPYDSIIHNPVWPDQCRLWNTGYSPNFEKLWLFEMYDQTSQCMKIKMNGGYVFFIDFDHNDKPDGCREVLCSPYWLKQSTYDTLNTPAFNTDNDDWFSTHDELWHMAKAWRPTEDTVHTMESLGIQAFNIRNHVLVPDDYLMNGQYSDCVYEQDQRYKVAVSNGWTCQAISTDHVRLYSYNPYGILLDNGTYLPTYNVFFSWWTAEEIADA